MLALARKIDDLINPLRKLSSCIASPVFDLGACAYLGWEFLSSGFLRFKDFLNGHFYSLVFIFDL